MTTRKLQTWAGVLGLTAVGLGAAGAHALKDRLAATGHTDIWQTAVLYHLVHAVGIVAIVALIQSSASDRSRRLAWAAASWITGILLFSGSLYALALDGPRWLGPITPVGGIAFLVGWALLLFSRPAAGTPPKN